MYCKAAITYSMEENSFPERIVAVLSLLGCEGIEESVHKIDAYFVADSFSEEVLRDHLRPLLKEDSKFNLEIHSVPEINWNAEWEKNFSPVILSSNCRVRAPFHKFPSSCSYDIIIEPKMAFGTGHHATTYLMLSQMLMMHISGKKIVDAGTGTGVLSILASKRGAAFIVACDTDKHAVENAAENFRHNKTENVLLIHGSVRDVPDTGFDGILANINKNVLISEMHSYANLIKEGGFLLCSGFFMEDEKEIMQVAEENSFALIRSASREGWAAMYFQRGS